MANMEIYKPECEIGKLGKKSCDSRATFKAVGAGTAILSCGAHVKTALFELTLRENASGRTTADTPRAVRS